MSSQEDQINKNQLVTLDSFKDYVPITDTQDDSTILRIVNIGNNELKKQLVTVVDDITSLEGTAVFEKAQGVALTYCMSLYRRDVNQMYQEAKDIMKDYESQLESLLGDVRAFAPKRTSRELVTRDVSFEDDYFAERRTF